MLFRGGVRHRVHFAQLGNRDFRVDLGRVQVGVPEHLLDEADVCTTFEHQRGATVPEQVTTAFRDAGAAQVVHHDAAQAVGVQRAVTVTGEEQRLRSRVGDELRATVHQVAIHPLQGTLADGSHAVLFTFALADQDHAALGIHVAEFEPGHFHSA